MLELRDVARFDLVAHGWGDWRESTIRGPKDEFSFLEEGEEVARVRIYPRYRLYVPYEELPPGNYVGIDRVVVRDDSRGKGLGPEAVALLIDRYAGQTLIAFSAADGLWERAGWIRAVRTDGDDLSWPLFFYQA
jgi:GNAT superfamily N-acetyltransferase